MEYSRLCQEEGVALVLERSLWLVCGVRTPIISLPGIAFEGVRELESVLVCAPPLIACTHPLYVPSVHKYIRCTQLRKCHAKLLLSRDFLVASRTSVFCLSRTNVYVTASVGYFFTLLLPHQNFLFIWKFLP